MESNIDTMVQKRKHEKTGLIKKDNLEYFNEYYHLKGTADIICECGALVKHASMTRHKKRSVHTRRLNLQNGLKAKSLITL